MKLGILLLSVFFTVELAWASVIIGKVFSSASKEKIIETVILVNGEKSSQSDLDGQFVLLDINPGDIIRAQKDGYVGVSMIASSEDTTLTLELAPIWDLSTVTHIYTDISDDAWFASAVKTLYEQQVLSVTEPGPYRPADSLTRAELATLAVNAGGFIATGVEETSFCDVAPNTWFAPVVELMRTQSWISGYDSNECETGKIFRPASPVNRAEAVKIILNVFDDLVAKKLEENICLPAGFTDVPDGAWFTDSVNQAHCLGLVSGYPDKTFRPSDSVNRAEIAVILQNALEKLLLILKE